MFQTVDHSRLLKYSFLDFLSSVLAWFSAGLVLSPPPTLNAGAAQGLGCHLQADDPHIYVPLPNLYSTAYLPSSLRCPTGISNMHDVVLLLMLPFWQLSHCSPVVLARNLQVIFELHCPSTLTSS